VTNVWMEQKRWKESDDTTNDRRWRGRFVFEDVEWCWKTRLEGQVKGEIVFDAQTWCSLASSWCSLHFINMTHHNRYHRHPFAAHLRLRCVLLDDDWWLKRDGEVHSCQNVMCFWFKKRKEYEEDTNQNDRWDICRWWCCTHSRTIMIQREP
jgi:hypothetical protein